MIKEHTDFKKKADPEILKRGTLTDRRARADEWPLPRKEPLYPFYPHMHRRVI